MPYTANVLNMLQNCYTFTPKHKTPLINMAVEVSKIKARLKAKYPKANLSTKRLDEISAKLAKKPEDDADDDAIDSVLEDYNDNGPMTFEEIAKTDDRLRTLETKKPAVTTTVEVETEEDEEMPKWAKKLMDKVDNFEQSRTQETIAQRFSSDKRLKGVPEFMLKGRIPSKDEDYETAIEELINDFKPYAEKHKLEAFGDDAPPSADTSAADKKGKVKEIDADMAAKIAAG